MFAVILLDIVLVCWCVGSIHVIKVPELAFTQYGTNHSYFAATVNPVAQVTDTSHSLTCCTKAYMKNL